jgi:hypothetical protein
MFEKVGQVAEQVATRLSRRAFLGKGGQWALALAGTLGAASAMAYGRFGYPPPHCCYFADGSFCRNRSFCPLYTRRQGPCPRGVIPPWCP